jgi:hypothetical protein
LTGSMLAMSRAAGEFASYESNENKRWNPSIFGDTSFSFDVERNMPGKPHRATDLYVWSQLILGYPVYHLPQPEHIPLSSANLTAEPHITLDHSSLEPEHLTSYCGSEFLAKTKAIPEPLIFNIHYDDQTYVKLLDFSIFAQWESVEMLLKGFESEGTVIEELWDVREDMAIWSGDWDARVYPGLEVDVTCRKPDVWKDDASCSSDEEEYETDQALVRDHVYLRGRRWWFARWRMKVEQESMGSGGVVREPTRLTVFVGALAMATFLGIISVFCLI